MTLANQLTMVRFGLALATFGALMHASPYAHALAFSLFVAAMVTDWVDGYVARTTHSVSPFGKVADPIADKVLVIGAMIGLSRLHAGVPLWTVFLIMARELLMGGVRVLTITQQGRILAAERWGKISMAVQSGSVLAMIALLVARELVPVPLPTYKLTYLLAVVCVAMAWSSAYKYFQQSRQLLEKSWGS